jgi:hypothetical protein
MNHIRKFNESKNDFDLLNEIFHELTDEFDVDLKITDIYDSKLEPNNYRVEIKSQWKVSGHGLKIVSLISDLKDKFIEMTGMKLFVVHILFNAIGDFTHPTNLGQAAIRGSFNMEEIRKVLKDHTFNRMTLCFKY